MTHFAALRHGESRTALVLLHQQLGIAEIATDRRAFAVVTSCYIGAILSRLRWFQWQIWLVLGTLRRRRRGRNGIDLHLRFHVHAGRPILRARRQTVPVLPEMLLRVAQERTEHIGGVPDAHRAHRIRSTLWERKICLSRWKKWDTIYIKNCEEGKFSTSNFHILCRRVCDRSSRDIVKSNGGIYSSVFGKKSGRFWWRRRRHLRRASSRRRIFRSWFIKYAWTYQTYRSHCGNSFLKTPCMPLMRFL